MQKSSRILLGLVFASAVLLGTGVALIIDIFTNVPDFTTLRTKVTYPIELANKEWTKREAGPKTASWVSIKEISNPMLMAVIASEDTSFFSHNGVDYHELKEAIKKDWETKQWARGGSTITQQVVKNVFLSRQKTLWRKLKEFLWAQDMEKVLTKSEILVFYLNMVEWGPNIYGIREASQHYFKVPPSMLTAKQAAFMAMLLPGPKKYYSYYKNRALTDWAQKRVDQILNVMNRMQFIDEDSYTVALQEPLWGVTGVSKKGKTEFAEIPENDPTVNEDIFEQAKSPVKSNPNAEPNTTVIAPSKEGGSDADTQKNEVVVEPESTIPVESTPNDSSEALEQ